MRFVTKYAMLAIFSASLLALYNCGKSASKETAFNADKTDHATDAGAILGGPPVIYPGLGNIGPGVPIEIDCNNGVDDNGNGAVDCEDPSCAVHPECSEYGPPLEEIKNSRSLTVYPNGMIVPEDVAILIGRSTDDDDVHDFSRVPFFDTAYKDCWIDPLLQDPYYSIPLGEPLVASPEGAIGPLFGVPTPGVIAAPGVLGPGGIIGPPAPLAPNGLPPIPVRFGPRAGLINECELAADLMFFHMDDDNNIDSDDDDNNDDDVIPQ